MTLYDVLLLGLPALLVGAIVPRGYRATGPRRWDLALALGVGAVAAGIAAGHTSRFALVGSPFLASDFAQYCSAVDAARRGVDTDVPHRSRLVGLALAPLTAAWGVRDALAGGAVIGAALVAAGLYLWGLAAGGRVAGVAAALFVPALGPLALLTRTVSFYPAYNAALALLAGATAMAVRRRSLAWLVGASALAGGAMLVDLKALPWTTAAVGVLTGVALWAPAGPRRAARAGARVVAVGLVLAGSWGAGRWVWPEAMGGTLEAQTAAYVGDVYRRAGSEPPPFELETEPGCGYHAQDGLRWGWGSPLDAARALRCAAAITGSVPAELADSLDLAARRATHLTPLLPMAAAAGGVALVGLGALAVRRRDPSRLLALLAPMPPVGFALWAALTQDADERRLATALLGLPVVVGVALAVTARWRWGPTASASARGAPVLAILPLGLTLLVLGVVPSGVGPTAPWRVAVRGSTEWEDVLSGQHARTPSDLACARAFAAGLARGVPERSRVEVWFGGVRGMRMRAAPAEP